MHGDIDNVIKFLAENLVFDEKGYPELIGATPQQKLLFGVRHSALHFAKTAGKIAAVSEDMIMETLSILLRLKNKFPKHSQIPYD